MKVLMIAPAFDQASNITYKWFNNALKKLKKNKDLEITTLEKDQVTRANFENAVIDADVIAYWDHGNVDKLAAQDKSAMLNLDNAHLLKDKEMWTVACLSSQKLGRDAIAKGAKLYQGYKQPFVLAASSPLDKLFERPANMGILSRFDHTIEECKRSQRIAFLESILACVAIPPLITYAVFLAWDLLILEYLVAEEPVENDG